MKTIQKKVKDLKKGDMLEHGKFDQFYYDFTERSPKTKQIVDFAFTELPNEKLLGWFTERGDYDRQVGYISNNARNIKDFVVDVFVD